MNQESKRHHYLPRFYLRQWVSGSDAKLWCYKLAPSGTLDERRVSTRQTAFAVGLYSAVDAVGHFQDQPTDSVEREFFGPIDKNGARVLRKLVKQDAEKLNDEEKTAWALFLNSLLERDPSTLASRDQLARQRAEEVFNESLSRFAPENRALVIETLTPAAIEATVRSTVRHAMILQIRDAQTIGYFTSLSWRMISLGENLELIATDLPLVINGAAERKYPISMLAIALSPKRLFLAYPTNWAVDDELIRAIVLAYNFALIFGPSKFLYSHSRLADGALVRLRTAAETSFGRLGSLLTPK